MALSPILQGSFDPSYARETPTGDVTARLAPPTPSPVPDQFSPFGFDEGSGQVWVNGKTFDAEDHQSALDSKAELDKPMQQMPGNFRPMEIEEFGGYIQRIKDPSMGRLIKKNVGIGVDTSQQLAGSALKFFGAEETGQAIIDQQTEDIRFNAPYQRSATDIDSAEGIADWFVANAAQMAPLMAEMIITSLATGGAAGLAAGASATGAKLLARGAAKNAASDAARGLAMLKRGEKLVKGSVEHKALRKAGAGFGAKAGAIAAAEGVAIGDIYQAVGESGNYDSPTLARLATALASIPYAAAEIAPAAFALKTAMGRAGKSLLTKGGRAKRFGKGFGVGSVVEGSTETMQDMLSLGAAGELDFSDPEVRNQLINAFAAGAGIGGPIGGVANAISRTSAEAEAAAKPKVDVERESSDMLNPGKQGEMFDSVDMGPQGEFFGDAEMRPYVDPQDEAVLDNNEQDRFSTDSRQMDLFDPEAGVAPAEPAPAAAGGIQQELDLQNANLDLVQGEADGQFDLFSPRAPYAAPIAPGQQSFDLQGGSGFQAPNIEGEQLELGLEDTRQGEFNLVQPTDYDLAQQQQAEQQAAAQAQAQADFAPQTEETAISQAMEQAQAQQVAQQQAEAAQVQAQVQAAQQQARDDETNAAAQPVYGPQLPQTQMGLPPSVINTEPNLPRKVDLTRKQSER